MNTLMRAPIGAEEQARPRTRVRLDGEKRRRLARNAGLEGPQTAHGDGEAAASLPQLDAAFADEESGGALAGLDLNLASRDADAGTSERLRALLAELARRNVALMREAAQLRVFHEKVQDSFARLERFVAEHALAGRTERLALTPDDALEPLRLSPGGTLAQRLPRASAGLSDLAVDVEAAPDPVGTLTATLSTAEDGQEVARWSIAGGDLAPGWLRLSLPAALDPDPMTPVLALAWEGAGPLVVRAAVAHPDPRFQAHLDGTPAGRVAALRLWSYVEGCAVPAPADAWLPCGEAASRRILSRDVLARARCLNAANEHFGLVEETGAINLHIVPAAVAIARLDEVVAPGTRGIEARIRSPMRHAPVIEFAIGLAPVAERPDGPDRLPLFPTRAATPWRALAPEEAGRLDLWLARPPEEAHDLYLLTRRAGGGADIDWGWALFERIALDGVAEG